MPPLQLDPDTEQPFEPDEASLRGFVRVRFASSDSLAYDTPAFRKRVLERLRAWGSPITRKKLDQAMDDASDDFLALESNVITPRSALAGGVGVAIPLGQSTADSVTRASRVFATLLAIVPRRIADEEVGDALEVISTIGFTGWRLWTKVVSTILWVLVNAVREGASAVLGKKKGGG